jgi:hypothetical protein
MAVAHMGLKEKLGGDARKRSSEARVMEEENELCGGAKGKIESQGKPL